MRASTGGLELRGVSHNYGSLRAVDRVDLEVAEGALVCLVGPSGCGKSTVLRIAAGLEKLQVGSVRIAGRVVADSGTDVPPEKRGIGMVFQDYALFPHLNVRDNVGFGVEGGTAARRARARQVLEHVGVADLAGAFPHTLSGGQQQRVALARALAPGPGVMLLDEPFSGLDARLRDQVRDRTLHVLKESGAASLIVTHDAEEAMFMADRIAVMREGRLVQVGAPVDLYCRPVDAFVAAFFGEVNRLVAPVEGNCARTPFGAVPTREPAGARVQVLIRPEALRLKPVDLDLPVDQDPPGGAARVVAARMLGRSSLVHLCVGLVNGEHLHLHARMPGQFLPAENAIVEVELDRSQTFVFPI